MNPRETSPAQKLSIPNSWFTLEKYVKNQVKWMILGYLRNLGKPQ
jgi:hypothetical protein